MGEERILEARGSVVVLEGGVSGVVAAGSKRARIIERFGNLWHDVFILGTEKVAVPIAEPGRCRALVPDEVWRSVPGQRGGMRKSSPACSVTAGGVGRVRWVRSFCPNPHPQIS